jgi:hypothetical protein
MLLSVYCSYFGGSVVQYFHAIDPSFLVYSLGVSCTILVNTLGIGLLVAAVFTPATLYQSLAMPTLTSSL